MELPLFRFRPYRTDDAEALAALANEPRIAQGLRDGFPNPYTLSDAQDFLAGIGVPNPKTQQVIEIEGRFAGGICVLPKEGVYDQSIEFGYWLGLPYWGRGLGTAIARAYVTEVFKALPVARVYANVYSDNAASRRLLEKLGFRLEGILRKAIRKDGVLKDDCIYAVLREEWEGLLEEGLNPPSG
ncbi:GNAT family protein [Nostoc sp. NIES-2111]